MVAGFYLWHCQRSYKRPRPTDSSLWHEWGREGWAPNKVWLFSLLKFVQRPFFNSFIIIIHHKKAKLRPQEALASQPLCYIGCVLIYGSSRMQRNQPQKHKSTLALILQQLKMRPPLLEKKAWAGRLESLQQSTALWKENCPKAVIIYRAPTPLIRT